MLVVIGNNIPPAVRGRMKLWFIEPRPNVFVSGVKDSVAESVIEYMYKHCPMDSGLIIFQKISRAPGYRIQGMGDTNRAVIEINGMQLVQEKSGSV